MKHGRNWGGDARRAMKKESSWSVHAGAPKFTMWTERHYDDMSAAAADETSDVDEQTVAVEQTAAEAFSKSLETPEMQNKWSSIAENHVWADNIVSHGQMVAKGTRRLLVGQSMCGYSPPRIMAAVRRFRVWPHSKITILHFLTGSINADGSRSIEETLLACHNLRRDITDRVLAPTGFSDFRMTNGVYNTISPFRASIDSFFANKQHTERTRVDKSFPGFEIEDAETGIKIRYFSSGCCVFMGVLSPENVKCVEARLESMMMRAMLRRNAVKT